jgi:single-strand DNA-binding protein
MNVVALIGRLTDNPELRKTSSDISVTRFSIAVDRPHKSGEERQADFISLVAWRQTAEFITRYFTKGQRIAIEGSLRMNRFTDRDGNNRTSYEVVVNNAHFVENKRDDGNGENLPSEAQNGSQSENTASSYTNGGYDDFTEVATDDDLPF